MHFGGWEEAGSPHRSLQIAHLALPFLIHSAVRKQKQKWGLGEYIGMLACIPNISKIK